MQQVQGKVAGRTRVCKLVQGIEREAARASQRGQKSGRWRYRSFDASAARFRCRYCYLRYLCSERERGCNLSKWRETEGGKREKRQTYRRVFEIRGRIKGNSCESQLGALRSYVASEWIQCRSGESCGI